MDIRIGQGIDVHQFAAGRKLIIGGVTIPSDFGLLGHSDADVLYHAVADALLGALALGDIGKHFPDTDASYKDVDSSLLVRKVMSLIRERGYTVSNADANLLLQKPKIAPYVDEMRNNIAALLGVETNRVSVKATTAEKMGFVGRVEGAVALASVLLLKSE
ncbi:2-C-methyl-D-erythritol 2,4-cyclodiphosphate synthase [uncultured bacterium]|nr:2-C-methyl-D-erythritol 2,4-cyclodiphosphate synthase [uncultured bacterium]